MSPARGVPAPPVVTSAIATVLCLAGAGLRVAALAQQRSLWYDEAALALSIVSRGFVGLLSPLDYLQTAPPLFLWLERLAVLALGPTEYALRAVPFVAGVLTPFVGWRVARQILPAPAALLMVGLLALAPVLVRYAAEAKPYAVDALVCLVLIDRALALAKRRGLAAELPERPRSWPRRTPAAREWALLAAAGIVALLISTPAVFVLAGVTAFLTARAVVEGDAATLRGVLAVVVAWAAVFGLLLITVFRPVAGEGTPIGQFMHWFWSASFLTNEPPGLATKVPAFLWAALTGTFWGDAAIRGATMLLLAAAAFGLVSLAFSRRLAFAVLALVPAISLAVAAALRRYPIADRLILFAAPLTAMLIGASQLVAWRERSPRALRAASVLFIVGVLALAGDGALRYLASDVGRQESRALVHEAHGARAEGVPVWISGGAEPAWRIYTEGANARPQPGELPPAATAAAAAMRADGSRAPQDVSQPGSRTLAADVAVGGWYGAIPERIVNVVDDTAAAAAPSAWSAGEAQRVRALARPCVSLVFTHSQPGEEPALLRGVAALGGRTVGTRRAPGAALHRVCFPAMSG